MKFKDCIGKKIVRMEGKDVPHCGILEGCYIIILNKKGDKDEPWKRETRTIKTDTLQSFLGWCSDSWDDGFWELYEPEKEEEEEKEEGRCDVCFTCTYAKPPKHTVYKLYCPILDRGFHGMKTDCGDYREKKEKEIRLNGYVVDLSVNPSLSTSGDFIITLNDSPTKGEKTMQRRIVDILVVDKDSNVALKDVIIYQKRNLLTDLTDEAIWFDIELDKLIKAHNVKRIKMKDAEGNNLPPLTLETVGRDVDRVCSIKEV
jgi:hypothetical protein